MPKGLVQAEMSDGRCTRREERPRENLVLGLGGRNREGCRLREELELSVKLG